MGVFLASETRIHPHLPRTDKLPAVVDINPHKWGKFLAGAGNEIVGPDALADLRPDVVVVMNPIYVDDIARDLAARGLAPEIVAL